MARYFVLLFLLCYCALSPYAAERAQTATTSSDSVVPAVDIEAFVREGCPHCEKAKIFLQTLQQEQPSLTVRLRDIEQDSTALIRLQTLAQNQHINTVRVPAFYVAEQLIVGYADDITTGAHLRDALAQKLTTTKNDVAGSCDAQEQALSCESAPTSSNVPQTFQLDFFGQRLNLQTIGLPLFTLAMGLLDGFNPCSLWVLILIISLLAPMNDRRRMLAIAGTFVAVEGMAYFLFMAAWLNLFLLIGLSRPSELIIAFLALIAGSIHIKDFFFAGKGFSLSIPDAAKPTIYTRLRHILQAKSFTAAMMGAVVLAILVQMVELLCTSGFPALFTRILTLRQLEPVSYYGYLLLYNVAYLFDDIIILAIGVITLSQRRLQEKEGRWLKLVSGLVMVGLGLYLLS